MDSIVKAMHISPKKCLHYIPLMLHSSDLRTQIMPHLPPPPKNRSSPREMSSKQVGGGAGQKPFGVNQSPSVSISIPYTFPWNPENTQLQRKSPRTPLVPAQTHSLEKGKWTMFHGCCWETFYIFACCGLAGNPTT